MTTPITKAAESELMTVAAFIARLEVERDSLDEAIRLMRTVARLLDTRTSIPEHTEHKRSPIRYNWVQARIRYERDGLGTSEIARLMGCSKQSIDWHRTKENWQRPVVAGNGVHP